MDAILQPPSATAFDAASSAASAAIYLIVALAAIVRAPRDSRTHVFLLIAICGIAPYLVSTLLWARGPAALSRPVVAIVALSLALGSLALFHFTQVFPWRRPWIRAHWTWLLTGYLVTPIAVAVLVTFLSRLSVTGETGDAADLAAASVDLTTALAMIAILVPVVFVIGGVLPFAGLLSLYKSWQAARHAAMTSARVTTLWMLISQLAGGVLTILVVPLLHLVAPRGPWVTIAAALLFACGLLMPIAFAIGVWTFRVLDLDSESPPDQRGLPA
jgi:hypothetical protein